MFEAAIMLFIEVNGSAVNFLNNYYTISLFV